MKREYQAGIVDAINVSKDYLALSGDDPNLRSVTGLSLGFSFILFREMLPNIVGTLITQIMVSIPNAIFLETFLSFVGLGLPLGGCSLGSLISNGFDNCLLHPYKLFPCMMILVALMLACNLVAVFLSSTSKSFGSMSSL